MTHPHRTPEDLALTRWLLSADGSALLARLDDLTSSGSADLRIAERLRADHAPAQVALAMTQRDLRVRARDKFASAPALWFTRDGIEQATSDRIAAHRAGRYSGYRHIVDLCCGIGGDLMALAALPGIASLTGVDLDPVHLLLARANVDETAPGAALTLIEANVREIDLAPFDAVFIDPARRSSQGRFGGVSSEPPLDWALDIAQSAPAVGIKMAPGIPHDLIPAGWELETVALGADLKEAVLWSPALARANSSATVIDDAGIHTLEQSQGEEVLITRPTAGAWLVDPNPAVTRAGLVEDLARSIGAAKIDHEIGFLVTSQRSSTPFGRALRVVDALPWHEKRLKARLRDLDAGPVDIRRRGLAGDVGAITKRLRGNGRRPYTVAMTRVDGEPWAIICDDPSR